MTNYLDQTTNAEFIPTIIAQKALGRLGNYMNLAKTVARETNLTTQTEGSVIKVPKRGALVANDKAVNTDVTVQDPTATSVSVTLNKHKEVTIGIEDVTAVLENQNSLEGYAQDAGIALAESVETSLATLYSSLTATPIAFDPTSETTIKQSMSALRKWFTDQKVPKLEQRNLYVDSDIYSAILDTDRFSRYDARGDGKAIEDGQALRAYGFNIFESQSVVETGTDPILTHGIAYVRDAFVLASRPLPQVPPGYGAVSKVITDPDTGVTLRVVSSYDPKGLAMRITLDLLYGVAVLDQRRAVEFKMTTDVA